MEIYSSEFHSNQKLPYHLFQGTSTEAPILVVYHGWAGSTTGYYDLAEELQELGYTVVLPDIVHHDSRGTIQKLLRRKYSSANVLEYSISDNR